MPSEAEVKAYLSKRVGWPVTEIGRVPPRRFYQIFTKDHACTLCGHRPASHFFRNPGNFFFKGFFCEDLVACEGRVSARGRALEDSHREACMGIALPAHKESG